MANDAKRFLRALFAGVEGNHYVLVWTLPGKQSHWYHVDQLDEAAAFAESTSGMDVYVGVALSPENMGERRRCPMDQVSGLVGLWADVDYADEVHKKTNLPTDEEAAEELLASVGLAPSIVVNSGHGLQAWWLFDEPWIFTDDADRSAASQLAARWIASLRSRAAEKGWTIDATQDLARVMRLPGTRNHKTKPARAVEVRRFAKVRYSPSDFDPFLIDDEEWERLRAPGHVVSSALRLDANASPEFDKLEALIANDTKFRQTWERTRKDLHDQSPSAYDQALASQAVYVGWSDQEIANLLIASRRKHGDDLKLRLDYYSRTITKARDSRTRELSTDDIEAMTDKVDRAADEGNLIEAHHGRRELVESLATMLGIPCTRWVRYTSEPKRYRLETTKGNVTLGTSESLFNQRRMQAAVADATRIAIPTFKPNKWRAIVQAILSACEDEDTGMESTDEGTAYAWLSEYLQDRTVLPSRDEAVESQWPYVEDGMLCVFGAPMRRWLWMTRGERVTPPRMGEVLRAYGAEHSVIPATVNGKRTTRSVWRIGQAEDLGIGPMGRQGALDPGDEPEEGGGEVF